MTPAMMKPTMTAKIPSVGSTRAVCDVTAPAPVPASRSRSVLLPPSGQPDRADRGPVAEVYRSVFRDYLFSVVGRTLRPRTRMAEGHSKDRWHWFDSTG